ncbi:hypothetical protein [Micromonospora zamorensis]|uniref:hypothetical protein n=1 Tax=Micromonospora zamorensis TaxID=709883 RepID=UPI0033A637A4
MSLTVRRSSSPSRAHRRTPSPATGCGREAGPLIALVTPLARADRLLGMSVTDLNTDEDPDRCHTRRVVEVLAEMLGG